MVDFYDQSSVEMTLERRIMKASVCLRRLVICYIVCVTCTSFVAPAATNPAIIVNEDPRENLKPSKSSVTTDEETQRPNFEFKSPYWITPVGDRIRRLFEESKESTTEGTILFSKDECSRYCIEKGSAKDDDNFQYINLFWSSNDSDTTDTSFPKGHLQLTMPEVKWTREQNANNVPRKCQIYLDLNCNTAEAGIGTNYMKKEFYTNVQNSKENEDNSNRPDKRSFQAPISIKVAEKYNLSERTETKFLIDSTMHRIIININGNVTNAVLRIPMNATVPWPGTVISWTRMSNADGVRIDTLNAPPGEWWMKLTGEDNSKYHFSAEGLIGKMEDETKDKLFLPDSRLHEHCIEVFFTANFNEVPVTKYHSSIKIRDDKTTDEFSNATDSKIITTKQRNSNGTINLEVQGDRKITRERSLEHEWFVQELNNQTPVDNSNDDDSSIYPNTENVLINYAEYATLADNDGNVTTFSDNPSDNKMSFDEMFSTKEQQKIHARSSIGLIENIDIKTPIKNNVGISMKMIEALDNRELSEELVNYGNENTINEKRMLIDVNRNSNLLVTPGTIHRVVFDVTNNCVLPVRYGFRVKSTPFRVYNLQPTYVWIYPGQMSNVAVDLIIPDNSAPDMVNTVTLSIQGTEIKEKSVYLYVQGSLSKLTDDVKPKIEYSFNNNCAGRLVKDRCYKSRWSMDITIQDYDSGLKRVISSPNEVYPLTEFISGTRSPITFYYSATCCDPTAKITAIDLLDNYNTNTIDVTVWNNLSEAEVAAITVGVLLALLFIILIVILIIYCVRRKKSLNLPYTQRYGSRPSAHAERTSF